MISTYRLRRIAFAALGVVGLLLATGRADAGVSPPTMAAPLYAAFHGGQLTIEGAEFGAPAPNSYVTFHDGAASTQVASTSLFTLSWNANAITLALPPSVRTGSVRIVADGAASAPREIFIFDFSVKGVPQNSLASPLPLDVAVAPGGRLWTADEFHLQLHAYSPVPFEQVVSVLPPQAPGDGIFAQKTIGDGPTRFSVLGEDVDVDSQGRVWFTQGGGYLYQGLHTNASRIIRYDPASEAFACFNAPVDHAEVVGVAIDEDRGLVWFAETGLISGNAITAFDPASMPSDCLFDPALDPWPPICPGDVTPGCYRRFVLPQAERGPAHIELDESGDVWFTQSWATSIGRLTPESSAIVEYPLPVAEATVGPGALIGSFPWQLAFDNEGDLWVNEFFDAEIYRFSPSLIAQHGCTTLDAAGDNPCAEEIFDGSNNSDGATVHSLTIAADGRIWFTLSGAVESRVGFISPEHGDDVALLPPFSIGGIFAGIDQDPDSGAVWFAMFDERRIGRLDPVASGGADRDGDGCADSEEDGGSPLLGGMRNPSSEWDFYDVNYSRTIDAADIGLVRLKFNPSGTAPGDATFDRSVGAHAWAPGPPDGRMNAIDIALVRGGYNHSCLALP